jgi:putative peptidoglycan lipid II flippase
MTIPQRVAVINGSLMRVLVPLLAGERDDRFRQTLGFFLLAGCSRVWRSFFICWRRCGCRAVRFRRGRAGRPSSLRIQLVGMVFAALNGMQWAVYHARSSSCGLNLPLAVLWPCCCGLGIPGGVISAHGLCLRMGLQSVLLAPG